METQIKTIKDPSILTDDFISREAYRMGYTKAGWVHEIREGAVIMIPPITYFDWNKRPAKLGTVIRVEPAESFGRLLRFILKGFDGVEYPCTYGLDYPVYFVPVDPRDIRVKK